jgi:capsular polysaccharide biosynthesis protein
MDTRKIFAVLRGQLALICAVGVLGGAVAYLIQSQSTEQYSATSQILVSPTVGGLPVTFKSEAQPAIQLADPDRVVRDAIVVSTTAPVRRAAAVRAGSTPRQLKHDVSVTQDSVTDVIDVTAQAASPALAVRRSDAFAQAAVGRLTGLEQSAATGTAAMLRARADNVAHQLAGVAGATLTNEARSALRSQYSDLSTAAQRVAIAAATENDSPRLVTAASTPTSASTTSAAKAAVIGLLAALVVAVVAVLMRAAYQDRLETAEELRDWLDAPVLAGARRPLAVGNWPPGAISNLAASCLAIMTSKDSEIVVCGVGAPEHAHAIAVALVDGLPSVGARGMLMTPSDVAPGPPQDRSSADQPLADAALAVVDAADLNTPEARLEATRGSQVLLVLTLSVTRRAELDEVLDLLRAAHANVAGAVLTSRGGRFVRLWRAVRREG